MKLIWATALLTASLCAAYPIRRSSIIEISDGIVLNYMLSLEHLENAFWKQGLEKFDDAAFATAGLPNFTRGRIQQISQNEAQHVELLQSRLGENATQPCTYNFPLSDAKQFALLGAAMENVGAAAYTGAVNLIFNVTSVVDAAAILAIEARQAAFLSAAVLQQSPWSTSLETPLSLSQAFSIAARFIAGCPATNSILPLDAFPTLDVNPANTTAGATVTLQFNRSASSDTLTPASAPLYLALLSGLDTEFVPIYGDGTNGSASATLPGDLQGLVYALVTNNNASATDSDTIAGVAVLLLPFDSNANMSVSAGFAEALNSPGN